MVNIRMEKISKRFNEINVLEDIDWEIQDQEFMVLVGPSGCGKTTLLKVILGSIKPNSGYIYINEKLINDVPISKRNIGFVPQNFGLFPHLTVSENIGYGLMIRKYPTNRINSHVNQLIKMLKLNNLEKRKPNQLSWGQQQRVALARALAIEPNLLLLDEPLSSVDWIARMEIANEIKRLQEKLNFTIIFVTHNIDEAFELGDRITVMNSGRIEQYTYPEDLIKNPKTSFVSSFVLQGKNTKRIQALKELD